MKKSLINNASNVVDEAVEGMLMLDNSIGRVGNHNSIVRADIEEYKQQHCTLISGGGSGHEPLHAGFIGDNMLSGAVLGNVFASPSVASILATIRVCAGSKGVLLIVKNYTGDRINFGLALELAKAEKIKVQMVIVDDDVALPEGKGITGGRGVAGTAYVHKIAGAVASNTLSTLEDVYNVAVTVVKNVRTMGIALSTCTIPGGVKSDRLQSPDEMEVGIGIHGESGRHNVKMNANAAADQVADILCESILARLTLSEGRAVAILVNNLGGLTHIELLVVARRVIENLKNRNISVVRANAGYYCTSLDMSGVSLSIMNIYDDSVLPLLDQTTSAPAWIKTTILPSEISRATITYNPDNYNKKQSGGPPLGGQAYSITLAICKSLISSEPMLTKYDMICGDGDCGIVMKAGATKVILDLEANSTICDSATFCDAIADSISLSMGGTSGGLLEIFFRTIATYFATEGQCATWQDALLSGLNAIKLYGGAKVGMRTMLDSLEPGIDALRSADLFKAVEASKEGMENTKKMFSSAGRSNYIDNDIINGTPDPGAVAVALAFAAAHEAMNS